jgi:hypothetical protein
MGLGQYEFLPVGQDPTGMGAPEGSFEPGSTGAKDSFFIPAGSLIIDDDDLTDDYPTYAQARKLAEDSFAELSDEVTVYENIDPEKDPSEYTEEETLAVEAIFEVQGEIIGLCDRLGEPAFEPHFPLPGEELSDLTFLTFTACKDRYDASGDGIVATFDLSATSNPQDQELADCVTITGGNNQYALNFWAPLTVKPSEIDGLPPTPRDGHPYSGVTVPMFIADYQKTADFSEWEGIAFWARLATASEAVPATADGTATKTPGGRDPLAGDPIPEGARPQDGVGQLGIMVQTMDTAAVLANDVVDGMSAWSVCSPGQLMDWEQFEQGLDVDPPPCFKTQEDLDAFDGQETAGGGKYAYQDAQGNPQSPERPFCIDYSPIDAVVGEEAPYRDQCWDGFRTMIDITGDWKFYFLRFSDMRQAGWGRVADKFRMDQVRSINFLASAYQSANVMIDEVAFYRQIPEGMGGSN